MVSRGEFFAQARAFSGAILVHLLMAALIVLGTMHWKPFRKENPVGLTIEAVIVDTSEIRKQREEARQAAEREERRQQRAAELEKQRQRELEQQKAEEQRQRRLEEQRKKEAADRLQKLRVERERKLEEERQRRELDKIRAEREAAEKDRKLEEERLKQLEARKEQQRQEQLRQQQEAQRKAQQEADARAFKAGQLASLKQKYEAAIQSFVTQNWLRPPTAQPGLRCTLKIVQIPGGEVISAAIAGSCNADEATRRSIVAAVERGGALPYRGFEDVFEREINFTFIYDGD
ncbi:MAG: TonB C-terminal domain-containing protein [Lysobacterales bacterium]